MANVEQISEGRVVGLRFRCNKGVLFVGAEDGLGPIIRFEDENGTARIITFGTLSTPVGLALGAECMSLESQLAGLTLTFTTADSKLLTCTNGKITGQGVPP